MGLEMRLELNYSTSAAGSLAAEILDANGTPISGFAMADCDPIVGDDIERVVTWKGLPNVSRLAGQPLRLRFRLKDADLFSLRFR
jgi:hypothetical protein